MTKPHEQLILELQKTENECDEGNENENENPVRMGSKLPVVGNLRQALRDVNE